MADRLRTVDVVIKINPEVTQAIRNLADAVDTALASTRALLAALEQEGPAVTQEGTTENMGAAPGAPGPPQGSQAQEDPLSALPPWHANHPQWDSYPDY
jgi:hypothetical protein